MTSPRPLSRRTALRGAGGLVTGSVVVAAGLATASCRSLRGGDAPPAGTSPTAGPSTPAGADDDAAIVTLVRRELSDLHAALVGVRTSFPSLRDRVDPFVRLHARHAGQLGGLVAASRHGSRAPKRPRTPEQALALLTTGEATLQVQLTHAATDAASGVLAATLASMVAAVAQLRVSLHLASAADVVPSLAATGASGSSPDGQDGQDSQDDGQGPS